MKETEGDGDMKKIISAIGLAVLVLGFAGIAKADTVELPLNCAGAYDVNTPLWTTDFDLGVTFSEISNVYIRWSGTITGELRYDCGSTFPVDAEFWIGFYKSHLTGYFGSAYMIGGADTYPIPESFDSNTVFRFPSYLLGRSELLDGQASIAVGFYMAGYYDFEETLIYPTGQLDSATLIFEGTVVPEPCSLVLLAGGMIYLLRKRKT